MENNRPAAEKEEIVEKQLVILGDLRVGQICYTPIHFFKIQVVAQTEFETTVKILDEVNPGAKDTYTVSNTQKVLADTASLDDMILANVSKSIISSIKEDKVAPSKTANNKSRTTRKPAVKKVEEPKIETRVDSNAFDKVSVFDFIKERKRVSISDIANFLIDNKIENTLVEAARNFRSLYSKHKKELPIIREGDIFVYSG